MSETPILRAIQVAMSRFGLRLFRNNVGKLQNKQGTWIAYGLYPGSSDLIGWRSVEVTEAMVGKRLAIFTAIEVKTPDGTVEAAQQRFIDAVLDAGGNAFVARSEDEAILKLGANIGNETRL